MRQLIFWFAQRIGIGPLGFQPDIIVAADPMAVIGAQVDMLETVERQPHGEIVARGPAAGKLLIVRPSFALGFSASANSASSTQSPRGGGGRA